MLGWSAPAGMPNLVATKGGAVSDEKNRTQKANKTMFLIVNKTLSKRDKAIHLEVTIALYAISLLAL